MISKSTKLAVLSMVAPTLASEKLEEPCTKDNVEKCNEICFAMYFGQKSFYSIALNECESKTDCSGLDGSKYTYNEELNRCVDIQTGSVYKEIEIVKEEEVKPVGVEKLMCGPHGKLND